MGLSPISSIVQVATKAATDLIDSTFGSSSTSVSSAAKSSLSYNDFMKLLITELSSQDPLQPLEDKDFVNQLVGLRTLETSENLNKTITSMVFVSKLSLASSLLGKEVVALDDNGVPFIGVVDRVLVEGNEPKLKVGNNLINVDQVLSVS